LENLVHESAETPEVDPLGDGLLEDDIVKDVPLIGVLFFVFLVAKEGMRKEGAAIANNAKGKVLVPGEEAPAFVTACIEIHVEIFAKVIGILDDGAGREVVDDLGKVEVVYDPLASLGGGWKIEPGDEIDRGVDVAFVSGFLFDSGDGVEEDGIEITALDKFVEVAFLVIAVAIEEVFVHLLDGDANAIVASIDAKLPKVREAGFVAGEAVGIEGERLADIGAVGSPTVDVDLTNGGHFFIDVE
jgi:hypothetical protein